MSEHEHKNLAEALVAFQAEAPTLPKDATNPHFRSKFTSLDAIVETIRPLLAKHGLAWSAKPSFGPAGEPALKYKLTHKSGETDEDVMPLLLDKTNSQGLGSAISYARRYSVAAVLNLVADEDDDGNRASQPRTANYGSHRPNASQSPSPELVTAADIKTLTKVAKDKGLTVAQIKQAFVECGLPRPEGPHQTIFTRVPRRYAPLLAEALTAIPAPELS